MRFLVFKDGKTADRFKLYGAYMFGSDGIAVRRAEITFKNGIIECKKATHETAGLALLWPVRGFGKALLPTTCLPERDQPYNLNVEIARAKLMQIVIKREDWAFFNNDVNGMGETYEQAQELFIGAIQNISEPAMAAGLADESLEKAIVFAEKLAVRQAKSPFDQRGKNHGFGRGCLACRLNLKQMADPRYLEQMVEVFGSVTIPVSWAQLEAEKGKYDFSDIDRCIELLSKKKLSIDGGPILRFSKEHLPKWLLRGKLGFEKIRETAYRFVLKLVTQYAGVIRTWRVVSGLNAFNHFGFNFEQVLEMTRAACMAVKAGNNGAEADRNYQPLRRILCGGSCHDTACGIFRYGGAERDRLRCVRAAHQGWEKSGGHARQGHAADICGAGLLCRYGKTAVYNERRGPRPQRQRQLRRGGGGNMAQSVGPEPAGTMARAVL